MGNNYFNKIINNVTIQRNISFLEAMEEENQEQCQNHLPIILGNLKTKLQKEDKFIKLRHCRCLLCGKNLTYDENIINESPIVFDATEYKKNMYTDMDKKYWHLLNILEELIKKYDDIEVVFSKFNKILSNNEEYTLKKSVTHQK